MGTSVAISGSGFSTTLANNAVKFNGVPATVTAATTIKVTATVPSGASTGRITVTVSGSTATSSTDFTIKPQVLSFTPGSGPVGTPITIQGEGFSPTASNNVVTLHGTAATVTSASPTQLVISVPPGATTGTIKVVVGANSSTSTASFTVTPSITSFSPDNGVYDTPVTIYGYNFSSTRSNNTVAFGGAAASVTSASATQLVANVPYEAVSGPITVTVAGNTAASPQTFSVTLSLQGLDWYGAVGDQISIFGTGFSPVISDNVVDFAGVPAVVVSATSTGIVVVVPQGAVTGPIHITSGGQSATTEGDFTVRPKITGFSPPNGLVGTTVNIDGTSFSAIASNNIVKFGSAVATIVSASATHLTVTVPSGAGSGPLSVSTLGQSTLSTDSFTVIPQLFSFSPISGPAGYTTVTINGEGFSTTPQNNVVTINGAAVTVTSATTQKLVVSVPTSATTGPVQVTVSGYTVTSAQSFTVAPKIDSFSPGVGPAGTSVTLQGHGFDATTSSNLVTFGGVTATVTSASATQLSVTVPPGANTGFIQVTVNGGTGRSDASFIVTATGSAVAIDGPSTQAITSVAGQNIVLTFAGTAGQYLGLGISMTTSPTSARPTVAISGPAGVLVPDTLCVGTCSFDLAALPATGTYTLTANPHGSATMNAVVTLSSDLIGTIDPAAPFGLALGRPGQIARLSFLGHAGDIEALEFADVRVQPSGQYALMKVVRPDGVTLVDWMAMDRTPLVHLQDGTYSLIIKRQSAAIAIATTITLVPPVSIGVDGAALDQDTRVRGNGKVGLLTFTATAGQRLWLGLVIVPDYPYCCQSSEDASVFVYAPDGSIIFAPDRFVTADGTIVILGHSCTNSLGFPGCSGGFEADQSGTYTIYVTPTHFRATLSTPETGQLMLDGPAFVYNPRPGQQGQLTFSGVSGQNLQLQWDSTTWSPDSSSVVVTSPDGSELTEFVVPTSGHVPGVAYLPTLPATGTYIVNVGICCGQTTYWPVALATQTCPPTVSGPAPSRTTITDVTPNPVGLNGTYAVTAEAWTCDTASAAGTMTIQATGDGYIVGSCSFDTTLETSCSIQALVVGVEQLLANFSPSDTATVRPSKGGGTVTVRQGQASVTIGNVTPAITSIGEYYSIPVYVAPVPASGGSPTGTVTVTNGTSSCTITLPGTSCSLSSSSAGVVTLTATYSGDAAHEGGTSVSVYHPVSSSGGAMPSGSEICGFDPDANYPSEPPGFTPVGQLSGSVPSAGLAIDIIGTGNLSVTVTSPSPNAITNEESIDVVGTFVGPTNTGITVDGVVGYTTGGGKFLVPNVPLVAGNNILTVTATTLPGSIATTTTTVTKAGSPPLVWIGAQRASGPAPASIVFDYHVGALPNDAQIQSVAVDYSNDGVYEYSGSTLTNAPNELTYSHEDIYTLALRVTDTNNITYTAYRSVLIEDLGAKRSMLCDVFGYLRDRLNAQDQTGAANAYQASVRDEYESMFSALGSNMVNAAAALGVISNGFVGEGYAEMTLIRDNSNQTRNGFPLRMTRGKDGVWRISEM